MEEYLPVIIAVAVLIYRVYTNFMKEQEKARKRNPSERPADLYPPDEAPSGAPHLPYEYEPPQELIEETYSPSRPYEPVYKHFKPEKTVKERFRETKYEPMTAEKVIVKKYKEDDVSEVQLSRAIHAPHQHHVMNIEEKDTAQERSAYADFDMEDAVIKSAILNRPEY